jgi:1,2-beta-oligoglucan phosphorylase
MKIQNTSGLAVEFLENGAVKSIEVPPIRISLKAGSPFSKPGTNLYLRKRGNPVQFHPLTGPESNTQFQIIDNQYISNGEWSNLKFACGLQLEAGRLSWQWDVTVKNNDSVPVDLDLVYLQDVGMKPINAGLQNEYYVSQYLERIILEDEKLGKVICCRQNLKEPTGYPWLMLACADGAIAGLTDGMQFYGKTYRETGIPEGLMEEKFGGEYAGESPVVALQSKPFILNPGEERTISFTGYYMPDHPEATSKEDSNRLLRTPSASGGLHPFPSSPFPLFPSSPFLPINDLSDNELTAFFGPERRHAEIANGKLLSFFSNHNHVVLRRKEVSADRPHAHIIQAKAGFTPDESIMATTCFAFGVFNSHISQGNTNFNVLLSTCTSQFNQTVESGQRITVEIDGKRYLLGVPSAFEMGLNHCRWIYKHGDMIFQVRTWTSKSVAQINLDFKVVRWSGGQVVRGSGGQGVRGSGGQGVRWSGGKVGMTITHDFDPLNGWKIKPGKSSREFVAVPGENSMIKGKFKDAQYRILIQGNGEFVAKNENSLFLLEIKETCEFSMSFIGEVCSTVKEIEIEDADNQFENDCLAAWKIWQNLSSNLSIEGNQQDIAAIREILPWYGMNALTHFLTPYGLEQFSGAAWGTRDVSQGPVDLLLNLGKYKEARQVLCTIFSNQNPDGGWPQWWMFDSYQEIRSDSSHDDIYYWCLIALASYIKVTGDRSILEEVLPYYHEKGIVFAEKTAVNEHVERLIAMIVKSFIPGTSLVPFGGGDWNDSLQPVSKDLARRMISSWTVEMNYQAFDQYRYVYEVSGNVQKANELKNFCDKIRADFNRFLIKDDIVAGYGLLENDGSISVMLHPSDQKTGVHYSILPMERGILSGIFTREQALHHQQLIEQHLKGPDGARLMDFPLKYKGGIQEIFQRAESSTFFGREIGLMYVHEHIRYAESLAKTGKADAFVKALRQAIPVAYRDVVPQGDIRQANCYYSSSDVHFKNRYEADERYNEVLEGKYTLRCGWRVYSSGPGIYIGLVVSKLFGLRIEAGNVILDPVMPFSMDGVEVSMDFMNYPLKIKYLIKEDNFSPKSVKINGKDILFDLEENKYRQGGAVIPVKMLERILGRDSNIIEIQL